VGDRRVFSHRELPAAASCGTGSDRRAWGEEKN
jgi:hypothetical protein